MLVKVKYVGEGEFNIHPDLTLDATYTLLNFDGSVPSELHAIIINGSVPKLVIGLGDTNIWQLVSVTTVTGLQVFPA